MESRKGKKFCKTSCNQLISQSLGRSVGRSVSQSAIPWVSRQPPGWSVGGRNILYKRSLTFTSLGFALLVSKDNTTTGFLGFASSGFLEPLVITGELSRAKKKTKNSPRDNMLNIRASNWLTLYKQYVLNVHVSCQCLFCSSHLLQLNLHHKDYKSLH